MGTIDSRRAAPRTPFRRRLVTALLGLTIIGAAAPGLVADNRAELRHGERRRHEDAERYDPARGRAE